MPRPRTIFFLVMLTAAVLSGGYLWHRMNETPVISQVPGAPQNAARPTWTPVTQQLLSHGRFKDFRVYSPHATPRGFILLLSGADGWSQGMKDLAARLGERGAMVVGIDAPLLDASLETDDADCVFPDGDLENLSHFIQAYYRLPTYLSPIVAGYGSGATLAYAMLAQAPVNTFAGAVSLGFCPSYPLKKRLCKGSGVEFTPHVRDGGVDFLPSKKIAEPWVVLQDPERQVCDAAAVGRFVAQVPQAQIIAVTPGGSTDYAAAFDALMARNAPSETAAAPGALKDLPIVAVAAQSGTPPSDIFAIMLSGDGGWAGLDKEVAAALAANGIPVVGLDSLRYFWSARTPEGLASDLDRIVAYYLAQLGKQRVLLIGYSQGADVLPFAVNRLAPATRPHVALTAVMGMSEHALFEFHMTSWLSDDNSGPPTLPEVERIGGMTVLCIYGEDESDSLCPRLDPRKVTIVKVKGGHHFDGNYAALATTILRSAPH